MLLHHLSRYRDVGLLLVRVGLGITFMFFHGSQKLFGGPEVWRSLGERAAAVGARIQTGTVFMNRCDYLDPALCWTGCKDTGRGGALSVIGFHNLTRPKSYHLKKG